MADIFGRHGYGGYQHYRELAELGGDPETYVRESTRGDDILDGKTHNFDALGSQRELQGGEPYGWLTDNLVAVQAVIEEEYRKRSRYERYTPITTVPDDAGAHAVTTVNVSGQAAVVDSFGTNAPTVQAGATNVAIPLHMIAAVAVLSDEDVRKAARGGIALQTRTVERALIECTERMAQAVLFGEGTGTNQIRGLLNQQTRGATSTTQLDRVVSAAAPNHFVATQEYATASFIAEQIGGIVEQSKSVVGNSIIGEVIVGLPDQEFNFCVANTIANRGSDLSIAEHVMRHNGWTARNTANSVRFEAIEELNTAGTGNTPIMLIALADPEIFEYPVAIAPRVSKIIETHYGFDVPVVSKSSLAPLIKRPVGIRYGTNLRA